MSIHITNNACVTALSQAAFSQKRVVHIQMAVSLAAFMIESGASEKAKDVLVSMYAQAGLDCASYTGSEYSTVRRKVAAAAGLYKQLGAEQIAVWIGAEKNGRAISAIAEHLGELKLDSIERVLAYSGAAPSVKPKVVPLRAEKGGGAPVDRQAYLFELETPHVHIHVDEAATNEELRDAVTRLQQLLRSRKAQKKAA